MSTLAVMSEPKRNVEFGAVLEELAAGRSNRELSRLTGVSHAYFGDMRWGIVPSFKLLEKIINGLELTKEQADDLLIAAEYKDPEAVIFGLINDEQVERGTRHLPADILFSAGIEPWSDFNSWSLEQLREARKRIRAVLDGETVAPEPPRNVHIRVTERERDPNYLVPFLVDRAEELTYEPEAASLTIHGVHGEVSPEAQERLERILRAAYSEERRRQGRE